MKDACGRNNPFWFRNKVKDHGPWDYKQKNPEYEAFGNFNYGATGAAYGFSDNVLKRMAGDAQIGAGTSEPGWGDPDMWGPILNPFGNGTPPYGDDPVDQYWISRGYSYYQQWWNNQPPDEFHGF